MKVFHKIWFLGCFICTFYSTAQLAQDSVLVLPPTQEIEIRNVKHLYPLFDSLYALKKHPLHSVNILHIGDSHIQGNYMTDKIRNSFYADFGLSGKGLAFPYKLAKANAPVEIKSVSNFRFNSWKLTQPAYMAKVGIMGYALLNQFKYAQFKIFIPDGQQAYSFNTVKVMYTPLGKDVKPILKDSYQKKLNKVYTHQENGYWVDVYKSAIALNELNVSFSSSGKYARCVLHAFHLSNSQQGGVCYNVAGLNSSQYRNWAASNLVAEQSKHLHPHLIMVSLGTNDANDASVTDSVFLYYVDKLISNLKSKNPKARFILLTPPDSYYRKMYPNARIESLKKVLYSYAEAKNIALWDLHKAMGGAGAVKTWQSLNVAATDLIHYSKTGYELQGQLFYQAFIKHYNEYVSNKYR